MSNNVPSISSFALLVIGVYVVNKRQNHELESWFRAAMGTFRDNVSLESSVSQAISVSDGNLFCIDSCRGVVRYSRSLKLLIETNNGTISCFQNNVKGSVININRKSTCTVKVCK